MKLHELVSRPLDRHRMIYIPTTQMVHILEDLTHKTEGLSPESKEGSWVLGIYPIPSMYGIFSYMYHTNPPFMQVNIHGSSWYMHPNNSTISVAENMAILVQTPGHRDPTRLFGNQFEPVRHTCLARRDPVGQFQFEVKMRWKKHGKTMQILTSWYGWQWIWWIEQTHIYIYILYMTPNITKWPPPTCWSRGLFTDLLFCLMFFGFNVSTKENKHPKGFWLFVYHGVILPDGPLRCKWSYGPPIHGLTHGYLGWNNPP